jgi:hypothetical protein
VLADFDNISPWWQKIRDMCCHSNNVLATYLLSIACRSVAKEVECNEVKAKVRTKISLMNWYKGQYGCNNIQGMEQVYLFYILVVVVIVW